MLAFSKKYARFIFATWKLWVTVLLVFNNDVIFNRTHRRKDTFFLYNVIIFRV